MKKVITLVVDGGLAKEILDEYYHIADFVSIETEAEYKLKADGWSTWDGDEAGYDTCEECGEEECDCDTRI